jgi:homoserine dehydrogenase
MEKLKIGLFGFGVVGEGLYTVLQRSRTVDVEVVNICVKNKKERSLADNYFTYSKDELLNNKQINVIVELIDDADEAYQIVKTALLNGKNVVSGNKKMLAEHLPELINIQKETGKSLLYDASACGSIPIIRNIEEYYDNDLLQSINGILNGSSNYILTQIFKNNKSYDLALKEAQDLGLAESNPTFDVDGFDTLYKLIIIMTHSFGVVIPEDKIFNFGISKINDFDIKFAKEKGLKIKLIAKIWKVDDNKISAIVIPEFIDDYNYIYNVEEEYNGVVIKGEFYDKQFMFGKGAGAFPTGSAVLSDITALSHKYKYEYKKQKFFDQPEFTNKTNIKIYLRYNDLVDFSHFNFEEIEEKHSGKTNYVVGTISIENLLKLQNIIPKLNVFIGIV